MDIPPNEWIVRYRQNPNNPYENGMAYDPETRRVVFHGGHVGRLYPQSGYTFLYDVAQNRFLFSTALHRPQRRCLVSVGYVDSCRRAVTVAGPISHGTVPQGVVNEDHTSVDQHSPNGPWLYDGVRDAWEDCRTLAPEWERRPHAAIAYELSSDVLAALGKEELVLFCPRTNRVRYQPLPVKLRDRTHYAFAADPIRRVFVLFGGRVSRKEKHDLTPEALWERDTRGDTWLYDIANDAWRECTPKTSPPRGMPGGPIGLAMTWHDPSGTCLLLQPNIDRHEPDVLQWGGTTLWSFDVEAETWTSVETKNPPACMGLLDYAAREDLLILFGGGTDGIGDDGTSVRSHLSRLVQVCRVEVLGKAVLPPPQPERIKITTIADAVTLTWPADEGAPHDVFRAEAGPVPAAYVRVGEAANAEYVDRDAHAGRVYAYQVARKGNGARRSLPAFTQAFRPSGLRASVESAREVGLRWNANAEPDIVGYLVYRAEGREAGDGQGNRLTQAPIADTHFTDTAVDLSDGVIRAYWVTAVNRFGVESGASPLAYTVPDAPLGFTVLEGISPSTGIGERISFMLSWQWPDDVNVAGFNLYHATENLDTLLHPGHWDAFWGLWTKHNDEPLRETEYVFNLPDNGPPHHYFYLRAVNVLGQEGFYTDLISPTDRRFRPAQP